MLVFLVLNLSVELCHGNFYTGHCIPHPQNSLGVSLSNSIIEVCDNILILMLNDQRSSSDRINGAQQVRSMGGRHGSTASKMH